MLLPKSQSDVPTVSGFGSLSEFYVKFLTTKVLRRTRNQLGVRTGAIYSVLSSQIRKFHTVDVRVRQHRIPFEWL